MIEGLSIRNYRSFGKDREQLSAAGRLNLIIGKNNVGKSNILRALTFLLPKVSGRGEKVSGWNQLLDQSSYSGNEPTEIGIFISLAQVRPRLIRGGTENFITGILDALRSTASGIWFYKTYDGNQWSQGSPDKNLTDAIIKTAGHPNNVSHLAVQLTGQGHATVDQNIRQIEAIFDPFSQPRQVALIPAIRSTKLAPPGSHTTNDDIIYFDGVADLGGAGLVDRLFKLQNPDISETKSDRRFKALTAFIQSTFGNSTARISVPHNRSAIHLEMDNQRRPLASYGSGIEQVVIIASAATVLEDQIICLEEPETNLHPEFQIRLLNYLRDETKNQFFITTHSSSVINVDGVSIYQIKLTSTGTKVDRILDAEQQHQLVFDLGYRPSDLAQANSIIWVEGPTDRIYLKAALTSAASDLIEGIDYSIMFYGGKLLRHVSASETALEEFIVLTRINRRSAVLIDSDKTAEGDEINETKKRVVQEFLSRKLFCWVTEGREIENYLEPNFLSGATKKVQKNFTLTSGDQFSDVGTDKSGKELDKLKLAHYVAENIGIASFRLNWHQRISELIEFIKASN